LCAASKLSLILTIATSQLGQRLPLTKQIATLRKVDSDGRGVEKLALVQTQVAQADRHRHS
jgi:hypothetical protein